MTAKILEFKKLNPSFQIHAQENFQSYFDNLDLNFQNGEKNIAIGSTQYKSTQIKSILVGISFFLSKYKTLKVGVVSFDLQLGLLGELLEESKKQEKGIYKTTGNFYLVNWNDYLLPHDEEHISDEFDFLFWDLPSLEFIKINYDKLSFSFEKLDALYLLSQKYDHFDDHDFMENIQKYFYDHGMDISPILPWKIYDRKKKPPSIIKLIKNIWNS